RATHASPATDRTPSTSPATPPSTSTTSSTVCAFALCFSQSLFTGKERDTESGNDYFGARYYSSSMGRFLSPDWSAKVEPVPYSKLDDPQSLNLYAYVENNPLDKVDVDGHCPWCVGALVGAAIGGGVEAYHEYKSGKGYDGWRIAGKALQGGVTGAVAVATGGASLLMQGAAVGAANVVTGMAVRGTLHAANLGKDPNVRALDKRAIRSDAVTGTAGGLAGAAVGQAVASEAGAMTTSIQVEAAQANNQIMNGIISGDAAQVSAGQAARFSADVQGAAVGGAASAGSNAASTVTSEAANAANEREQHHD
ncbi:MAG: RHS repeat-associated core domain-containing protein, partial [Formivibrio sp.]|nr:RHS repeat-associated core domain-containing protein [Formivibrio sp.]